MALIDDLQRACAAQAELVRLMARTTGDEHAAVRRLGLSSATVTAEAVQQAYRRLAMHMHPDGGGSADAFRRLTADRDRALRAAEWNRLGDALRRRDSV